MTPQAHLQVRVTPRSSRNRIEVDDVGSEKVWVTAAPTDGQANAAVCDLIAKKIYVPKSSVSVVRGETSRDKQILVEGVATDEALRQLRR